MAMMRQTARSVLSSKRFLPVATSKRNFCSHQSSRLLTLTQDEHYEDVAVLKMVKKPDNTVCTTFLKDFSEKLQNLEESSKYRAVVLSSGVSGVFIAGLDIESLCRKPSDDIYKFWSLYQDVYLRLYGSRLITVAAINGSATSIGCALATACDSRIMVAGNHVIGNNETKAGWMVPSWVKTGMINLIGFKNTERSFQIGTVFSPDDALKIGLVDKVVPENQLMTSVRECLKESASLEDSLRISTKEMMRQDNVKRLRLNKERDVRNMTIYSLMNKNAFSDITKPIVERLGWKPVPWSTGG